MNNSRFFALIFYLWLCPLWGASVIPSVAASTEPQSAHQLTQSELDIITTRALASVQQALPAIEETIAKVNRSIQEEEHKKAETDPYWGSSFRKKCLVRIPISDTRFYIGVYGEDIMRLTAIICDLAIKKRFFTTLNTMYFDEFFDRFEDKKKQLFDEIDTLQKIAADPSQKKQAEAKQTFLDNCTKIFTTECRKNSTLIRALVQEIIAEEMLIWTKNKIFPDIVQEYSTFLKTTCLPTCNAGVRCVNSFLALNEPLLRKDIADFNNASQVLNEKLHALDDSIKSGELTIPLSLVIAPLLGFYGVNILFNKFPVEMLADTEESIGKVICKYLLPFYSNERTTKMLQQYVAVIYSSWTHRLIKAYCLWNFPSNSFEYYQENFAENIADNYEAFIEQLIALRDAKIDIKSTVDEQLKALLTKQHSISFFAWVRHMDGYRFKKQLWIDLGIRLPVCIAGSYVLYSFIHNGDLNKWFSKLQQLSGGIYL